MSVSNCAKNSFEIRAMKNCVQAFLPAFSLILSIRTIVEFVDGSPYGRLFCEIVDVRSFGRLFCEIELDSVSQERVVDFV
jgi:hypothetical protein